jgi:hypothetical protein
MPSAGIESGLYQVHDPIDSIPLSRISFRDDDDFRA